MGRLLALVYLVYLSTAVIGSEKQQHRVQHGPCSYTFILPEVEHCQPLKDFQVTNSLQRDSPPPPAPDPGSSHPEEAKAQPARSSWQERKLESLESSTENNTQWLQKLERSIQENLRSAMEEMKRNAVHTQTAAMLEIGTNLLSKSAEQTLKLTDVETKVLNQTSRMEIQLLEYSLFTNRLEKHVLQQNQEISRLNDKSSSLEQRFSALEARHVKELQDLQREKQQLQDMLERQRRLVTQLNGELGTSTHNSTLLQKQQAVLTDTVQQLLAMVTHCNDIPTTPKEEPVIYRNCAEIFRSGLTENGVHSIRPPNSTHTVKVRGYDPPNSTNTVKVRGYDPPTLPTHGTLWFCNQKWVLVNSGTLGPGQQWYTLVNRVLVNHYGSWSTVKWRLEASSFPGWRDYKMGFGDPSGEYWAGNDLIHLLTSSQEYSLQVQLKDAEGNEAYSHYNHFYIDAENKNYSLHAQGFSGTAGRTSSLTQHGTQFSTKDRDNDRCSCKCAQMSSGGWWFEACGPSNLNGIYYSGVSNVVRYNGIKWYYWKGPSLMTTVTTMMVRPAGF
ncbi:angiopoietin-2 [Oncorhynchus tshawytscha]|uniref:angiopoietin-2 n=1 Tax=Oncorhynchus tshawytscha TaxID=74940 RepID=UPI001C3CF444|nr:angiopoietin-2 [Oncorhynchus tshawytscha]